MSHPKVQKKLKFHCRNLKIESSGNDPILKVFILVKYYPGLRETQEPDEILVEKMERLLSSSNVRFEWKFRIKQLRKFDYFHRECEFTMKDDKSLPLEQWLIVNLNYSLRWVEKSYFPWESDSNSLMQPSSLKLISEAVTKARKKKEKKTNRKEKIA